MSAATCGDHLAAELPGIRFAYPGYNAGLHSALRLSAFTIGVHFSFSVTIICASASGGPPRGRLPTLASADCSAGDRSPSLSAPLSLPTITGSVPAGAKSPVQVVTTRLG